MSDQAQTRGFSRPQDDDDRVMDLVESTLALPPEEREASLRSACSGDTKLFSEVWKYIEWDERLKGFLTSPLLEVPQEHPFEAEQILHGRFKVLREVGQGGMGVVYEAFDTKLDRRIAIKCSKEGFSRRLPPEVRLARDIAHPNVCKLFDIHTAATRDGEIDFIAMEYLDGGTLAARLESGPIPAQEALTIALQLCSGLAEAHRNQVIHGDLKSNNIILTKDANGKMRAVIMDFGLARRPESAQGASGSVTEAGAPNYMAPELLEGGRPTVRSDIYALGVILYELDRGRLPQGVAQAPSPGGLPLAEKLARRSPAVNPRWNRTILRCLESDPSKRFASAAEVADVLAPRSRRWFLASAAAAAAAAAAGGSFGYFRGWGAEDAPSVAVLPFANGRDAEGDYISEGISENLIHALSQFPSLKVIARTSSFKFRGDKIDVRNIAQSLGVRVLVTGRVTGNAGRRTIDAELINGGDGVRLWGGKFNPGEDDLAAVEAQMAGQIAERIGVKFTQTQQARLYQAMKAKPEAYELLLRGRYQIRLYTPESRQRAVSYYEQALALDPTFALANAELAFAYRLLSGGGVLNPAEMMPKAQRAADRALSADRDLAEAHAALADIEKDQWDWAEAEREYRRAIELSPSLADAHMGYGIFLSVRGRFDAALAEVRRLQELDPLGVPAAVHAAAVYYNHRQFNEALAELDRAVAFDPSAPSPWMWKGMTYGATARYAEAIAAYKRAIALGDDTEATQCFYVFALARSGQRAEAEQILKRVTTAKRFVPQTAVAVALLGLGKKAEAMQTLEDAYRTPDPLLQYLEVEAHYDELRDEPRYHQLAAKVGLPPLPVR
jgi:TolB-like protein/Tfp pilus assembly protein PilF